MAQLQLRGARGRLMSLFAQVKEELHNKKWHGYTISKRIWAQKPLEAQD